MKALIMAASLMAIAGTANAQGPAPMASESLKPTKTLLLYPKGQTVNEGIIENGKTITLGPGDDNGYCNEMEVRDGLRLAKIGNEACINLYIPKNCNGQMIVISPGGGYSIVASAHEGINVARWCVANNIAACVVHYRLPNKHCTVPLTDMQNAFRYCRAHAAEWGVKKIGVMGFSAGGHLAASTSVMYVDEITRPDFSVLVYPVIDFDPQITHGGTSFQLTGGDPKLMKKYSMQYHINENTPPTILILSSDDRAVNPENSIRYFQKCKENKVPVEMYMFPFGGHGWGFKPEGSKDDALKQYRADFYSVLKHFLDANM